ncbi:UNKNOWN [Stylonychia lemnae]|uniref:Uncharacterized protein n=1 Tax=Stylonychia lemnae TaxID=5949 RepID=A0A078ALD2_STYLE|nr:UNKNOWN [Stylonychia lemnae]|eukprot:CDW83019.1 UNKNOWN [Stylonychia lemnae]
MKQNLSQYFDLRSARLSSDIGNHKLSFNENRGQLLTAVSEKILIGHTQQTSPEQNDRRSLYLDALGTTDQKELSGSKQFTLTRLSNNNTDQQPINQFLTSDGESERNLNYENMIQSTEGRGYPYVKDSNGNGIMFTNQTSSSMKNVPMSYSSTNSRGYLDNRFKRLHEIGSPIQEQSTVQRDFRHPRFSEFSGGNMQSSNKKSVKFLDEQQTESKYTNNYQHSLSNGFQNGNHHFNHQNDTSNIMSISDNNLQFSNYKENQMDGDTSQIIQAQIDVRMNEINSKYFSNESSANRIISSRGDQERVIKPIIKSIDTTMKSHNRIESLTPLSDTKRDPIYNEDDDEDKNSLVAMEEAIENEKSRVHNKIDQQFFSNRSGEPSIVIKNRLDKPSVFTSTNSFERLRDEILNNQSYSKPALDSEFGTQNRSLQMVLADNFNKGERSLEFPRNFNNGQTQQEWTLNNQTQLYQDTLRSEKETMESIKNYIPLRKSRERNLEESKVEDRANSKNMAQRDQDNDQSNNFRDNLLNQNKEFENKLQSLKSKISSIHRQNSQQNILSAEISRQEMSQNLNTIISTPTVRDLNSNQQRSLEIQYQQQNQTNLGNQNQQYSGDILILNQQDFQTNNSSRGGSSFRNSSKSREDGTNAINMNTKDL